MGPFNYRPVQLPARSTTGKPLAHKPLARHEDAANRSLLAMDAFRRNLTSLLLASLPIAALAVPVSAQVDDGIVLDIMRQCARIDDASARLACYDNNVRVDNANTPRNTVPGVSSRPQASIAPASAAAGFGHEAIRTPERFQTPAGEIEELHARVRSVDQQGQGVYLLTLEDGAQWLFSETVDFSYRPPRAGSSVSIDRGALGSFLLNYDHQGSVRVRRIR